MPIKLENRITYETHKTWFKTVFNTLEWKTRFGKDILAEARSLGYQIATATFVKIRREIRAEIKHNQEQIIPRSIRLGEYSTKQLEDK